MLKLYENPLSGNCYKVRLLLAHLDRPYDRVEVSVVGDRARRDAMVLRDNPSRRVPVLELDDGRRLCESNAILCYLAEGTPLLPADAFERAQVLRWLFFEQNHHEPNVATRRYWIAIREDPDAVAALLRGWLEAGTQALRAMEEWLTEREWFAAERFTIADIALYAYTHVAREGGFDLDPLPAVRAWLDRVAALPGHAPIRY